MKHYSKQYDSYTIRTCDANDIPELMCFINKYWAKGHVLSVSRKLMDWQYYNPRWNRYNFLIGVNSVNEEIIGILGYIPTYLYDAEIDESDKYIWLALWKVREGVVKAPLGIQLLNAVFEVEGTSSVGTVGINQTAEMVYRTLRYKTGVLEHYYITNDAKQDYSLFIGESKTLRTDSVENIQLSILDDEIKFLEFFEGIDTVETCCPLKTKTYFINRYMKHPFYRYKLYGLEVSGMPAVMLVCRVASAHGSHAVRIVDLHGTVSEISGAYSCFQKLLMQNDAEYMDLYCYGLDEIHLAKAGFKRKTAESTDIVPNYYEPFDAGNVDIRYAYHSSIKAQCYIFKGDGDQDRPNERTWDE